MGYSLLEFMKRLGIFIICAQSFIHFTSGKSYEKYVKLLVGMMILAQFVVPVRAIFLGKDNAQIAEQVDRFRMEMKESLSGTEAPVFSGEESETVSKALQEEMLSKCNASAEKIGYRIKGIEFDTQNTERTGLIITVVPKETNGSRIQVDKIEIGTSDKAEIYPEKVQELKAVFSVCLGTEPDDMEIVLE